LVVGVVVVGVVVGVVTILVAVGVLVSGNDVFVVRLGAVDTVVIPNISLKPLGIDFFATKDLKDSIWAHESQYWQ
jgi:hypothetical protein